MRASAEKAVEPDEEEKREMDEMMEEQFTPSYLSEATKEPDEDYESEILDDDEESDEGEIDSEWMRISKD